MQVEVNKPALDFLSKVEVAYRRAQEQGTLRPGLELETVALDTPGPSPVGYSYDNYLPDLDTTTWTG